jgi:hypothetical protein
MMTPEKIVSPAGPRLLFIASAAAQTPGSYLGFSGELHGC